MQQQLDEILPGYEALAATSHDWLADEFAGGTWAIHRPGWYTTHHAEMQRPEGRVVLAGSDLANGWSGFIDGAIESGLRAGAWAAGAAGEPGRGEKRSSRQPPPRSGSRSGDARPQSRVGFVLPRSVKSPTMTRSSGRVSSARVESENSA